jgi:hypothetical protein
MKQQEIIWQEELKKIAMTNLISKRIFILILICLAHMANAQENDNRLSDEQYRVIQAMYSKGNNETIIFNETIDYKSWINLIQPDLEDNYSSCPFEDPNFPKIVDALRIKATAISIMKIEQTKLPSNIKLSENSLQTNELGFLYPTRRISEPIIIDNYAFVFDKTENAELLFFFRKDENKGWEWKCFIECFVVFID